jgi:hypothetical protein
VASEVPRPEDLERLFDLNAQMRKAAAALADSAQKSLQVVEGNLQWFATNPKLTPDDESSLREILAELRATTRTMLANLGSQTATAGQVLAAIDPDQPEHVGIVAAEAEAFESMAANLRTQAAAIRLVHETERRVTAGE